jgi:hypothetical protein
MSGEESKGVFNLLLVAGVHGRFAQVYIPATVKFLEGQNLDAKSKLHHIS